MRALAVRLSRWLAGDGAFKILVAAIFLFLGLPIIVAFLIAVNPRPTIGMPTGFSLRWFAEVLQERSWLAAYGNSLLTALVAAIAALVSGTLFAYASVRFRFRGRGLFAAVATSPLGMPRIIIGVALLVVFNPVGLSGTFSGLIIGFVVITTPYIVRTVGAVLDVYDPAVEEAALTLGADEIETFFRITLPMIAPGLISAAILAFVYAFGNLQVAIFLTGPETVTIPVLMFSVLEFEGDPTVAAVACLNILIVATVILVANRLVGSKNLIRL
jgi:putative spermidine/putrescine transport system permease protein